MRRFLKISLLLLFSFGKVTAQTASYYVIPELCVGFMPKSGWSFGADVNFTVSTFYIKNTEFSSGIGLAFRRFKYQQKILHSWSANIVNFSNFSLCKIGLNTIRSSWSGNHADLSKSGGIGWGLEIGASPNIHHPWLSFRSFYPKDAAIWLPGGWQHEINLKTSYAFPLK